jgi:hypothetical protein
MLRQICGSFMHFKSLFRILVILKMTLMMIATTIETCRQWKTCDKHILHTCICWSYSVNWSHRLFHSPALILHSSRTGIQLGLFSSKYSLRFSVSHLTHTVQSGPRDVEDSKDYVFTFLNRDIWLISETLQTVSQIQMPMSKEHPYT